MNSVMDTTFEMLKFSTYAQERLDLSPDEYKLLNIVFNKGFIWGKIDNGIAGECLVFKSKVPLAEKTVKELRVPFEVFSKKYNVYFKNAIENDGCMAFVIQRFGREI